MSIIVRLKASKVGLICRAHSPALASPVAAKHIRGKVRQIGQMTAEKRLLQKVAFKMRVENKVTSIHWQCYCTVMFVHLQCPLFTVSLKRNVI